MHERVKMSLFLKNVNVSLKIFKIVTSTIYIGQQAKNDLKC